MSINIHNRTSYNGFKKKVGEYMVNDRYFKGSIVSNKGTLKNHLNKSHRAILQTLERSIWGIYFPQDLFNKYLDRWDGIPVIYGPQHPDITKFSEDPEAELNRVGGRIAGVIHNIQIQQAGHPRLYADVTLTDEYAEGLIDTGQLGLSTGFQCADDGFQLIGQIYPSHVLVFFEDQNNLPADYGAGFLNKRNLEGAQMGESKTEGTGNEGNKPAINNNGTGTGSGASPAVNPVSMPASKPEENLPPISGNQGSKDYLNLREQYIQDMTRAGAVNEALTSQNEDLKARLHAFEVRERNNKIQGIITLLPSEMVKRLGPDNLTDRLNNNPLAVMESVVAMFNDTIARITQASRQVEGTQYLNQATSNKINKGQNAQNADGSINTDGLCSSIIVE